MDSCAFELLCAKIGFVSFICARVIAKIPDWYRNEMDEIYRTKII